MINPFHATLRPNRLGSARAEGGSIYGNAAVCTGEDTAN